MAGQDTAKKFMHGNKDLPILYEDSFIRIFTNSEGDLFIRDLRSGAEMRISSCYHTGGGLQFTTEERVEPININNMIGWRISK